MQAKITATLVLGSHEIQLRLDYESALGSNGHGSAWLAAFVKVVPISGFYIVKAPPIREVCQVLRDNWPEVEKQVLSRATLPDAKVRLGEW